MKLLFLLAAAAVCVAAIPVPETTTFGQFKARYGKNYVGAEHQLREAIFNANLAKIAALNQQDPSATSVLHLPDLLAFPTHIILSQLRRQRIR